MDGGLWSTEEWSGEHKKQQVWERKSTERQRCRKKKWRKGLGKCGSNNPWPRHGVQNEDQKDRGANWKKIFSGIRSLSRYMSLLISLLFGYLRVRSGILKFSMGNLMPTVCIYWFRAMGAERLSYLPRPSISEWAPWYWQRSRLKKGKSWEMLLLPSHCHCHCLHWEASIPGTFKHSKY